MNFIKHSAITFKKKNGLAKREITFSLLCKAAHKNGFIVKDYSSAQALMILLDVYDKSLRADSVTSKDSGGNIIIFINDKISARKRMFILAHEIGHIVLQHGSKKNETAEKEADLFAHYLLDDNKSNRPLISALCILIAAAVALTGVLFKIESDNTYITKPDRSSVPEVSVRESPIPSSSTFEIDTSEVCFYTPTGDVYHLYRDCSYIEHSKNVTQGTVSLSGKKRCCSLCERRKEKQGE